MKSELVKPIHLARKAVVYIRQSTTHQVVTNQEGLRLQYALRQLGGPRNERCKAQGAAALPGGQGGP